MKKLLLFILFPILTYGQVQIGQDIDGDITGDLLGVSVSISSNGDIIAVGASQVLTDEEEPGYVRIFENQEGTWTQIGQDINGDNPDDVFGFRVSISSDGNIIAISAVGSDVNGGDSGQVKIYENQEGDWTQIGQNINGEGASESFGTSVNLSSDGGTVAIGASTGNVVRVYSYQEGNWIQIGEDIEGRHPGDILGGIVRISSNGSILAASSLFSDGSTLGSYVRVYENQEENWTQIGQDIDGNGDMDLLGRGIDLSSNGNFIAIGIPAADNNGPGSGSVRVYENQDDIWVQVGQDIDGENADDFSGISVNLSSDGTIIGVGASLNDNNGNNAGSVKIYENQGNVWTQIGEEINGEAGNDRFGSEVQFSSNASTLIVGAPFNSQNGNVSGHVRVFDLSALLSTEEFTSSTFSLYPNPASTQITIDIPQEDTLEKVTIYNSLGQLVLSSKSTTIDTSALSKGMYIVEVLTNQAAASKKLIIE